MEAGGHGVRRTTPFWTEERLEWVNGGSFDRVIFVRRSPYLHRFLTNSLIAQESSHYHMGSPEAYTLHRIIHGVPEGQVDIPPTQAFPMESNLDVMGACK